MGSGDAALDPSGQFVTNGRVLKPQLLASVTSIDVVGVIATGQLLDVDS